MFYGKINPLIRSVLLAIFFAATTPVMANDSLIEAERLYGEGQFENARQIYKKSLTENPSQPSSFYYNHGTASFRAGAVGEAFVFLMRAAIAQPLDSDIQTNLRLVREKLPATQRTILPSTWISWWPAKARSIPWQAWLVATLACLAPFLWGTLKSPTTLPWQWSMLGLAALGLFGTFCTVWQTRAPAGGIILTAKVLSGPGKTFPGISTLEPGSLVNVEETREGWSKVRYVDSRLQETVGWIESPTVLKFD